MREVGSGANELVCKTLRLGSWAYIKKLRNEFTFTEAQTIPYHTFVHSFTMLELQTPKQFD
jgi:hypothetical protein